MDPCAAPARRHGASVRWPQGLRVKLATMGIGPPVLQSIERELKREGLSLGPLAKPSPVIGTLASLTPQALAGRWLSQKM